MASGMGMPSMGIYSYELFHTYDVDNIIRVGSVGSISPRLKLRDVVLGQAACTDSNYPRQYGLDGTFSPIADFTLLESAVSAAHRLGVETAVATCSAPMSFTAGRRILWPGAGWACWP